MELKKYSFCVSDSEQVAGNVKTAKVIGSVVRKEGTHTDSGILSSQIPSVYLTQSMFYIGMYYYETASHAIVVSLLL